MKWKPAPTINPVIIGRPPAMPMPEKELFVWACVMCDDKARTMHKGTAYCRRCYDELNRAGKV